MTLQVLFANSAGTTLAAPITNAQTSITVTSGSGALFPSPAAGQYFSLTLSVAGTPTTLEVVYCTARTGDTLTVTRAQEGTAALAFNAGDNAQNLLTAGDLATLANINGNSGNVFKVANATTASEAVALGQFGVSGGSQTFGSGSLSTSASFTPPTSGIIQINGFGGSNVTTTASSLTVSGGTITYGGSNPVSVAGSGPGPVGYNAIATVTGGVPVTITAGFTASGSTSSGVQFVFVFTPTS
jgi:hypothetical protein